MTPWLTLIDLVNKVGAMITATNHCRQRSPVGHAHHSPWTAEITVGLPREQAIALFTAEGERRWPRAGSHATRNPPDATGPPARPYLLAMSWVSRSGSPGALRRVEDSLVDPSQLPD